jgi:hypothetical protein
VLVGLEGMSVAVDGFFRDMVSLRVSQHVRKFPPGRPTGIRIDGEFLRGPIPLVWLTQVCALPGQKVLAMALAIWFVRGLRGKDEGLELTPSKLKRFGVDKRHATYRALKDLEKAGLISVRRHSGRSAVVTILHAGADSPDSRSVPA